MSFRAHPRGVMLNDVAAWELDAALEEPHRYLLRTDAIDRIASGDVSLVIGERGAGKTAASRLLVADSRPDRPAIRIALKDTFLAALRPLADPQQRRRASASVRYLVLLGAFEAMLSEQLLQGSVIRDLAGVFAVRLDPTLESALPHAFSKGLLFEIFGDATEPRPVQGDVESQIFALEHAVANALGRRRVLVLFDESADRSVVAGALDALRVDALKVLLQGVRDLEGGPAGGRVTPVVFTRPGLYARLLESDRDGWRERRFDLVWSSRDLRAAACHRLARAKSPTGSAENGTLQRFFSEGARVKPRDNNAAWNTIWPRTRARPRDVVVYIRAVARSACHRGLGHVDDEAVRLGEIGYAAYLRQDMADEIRDVAPDVEELLDGIARHGKRRMTAQELVETVERLLSEAQSEEGVAAARSTIERFFEASALGNWIPDPKGGGRERFVHDEPGARLDYHQDIVVHPGLAAAIGLGVEMAA